MAEFVVRVPGQPEQVVSLPARPFTIGRAPGCDFLLAEKKASKRHLQVEALPGGGWVLTDLQSSNGTLVGEQRVLRRVLVVGDVVKVGDSTLELRAGAPAPAPAAGAAAPAPAPTGSGRSLITLAASLQAAPSAPAPAAPAAETGGPAADAGIPDAAATAAADAAEDELVRLAEERRSRAAGARAVRRGAVVLALGIGAVVLAVMVAGGEAERRKDVSGAAAEYSRILGDRDRPFALLEGEVQAFHAAYPDSPLGDDLDRLLAPRRQVHEAADRAEAELDSLRLDASARPTSEVLGRLLALRQRLADDPRFSRRVDLLAEAVERRRDEILSRERAAAETDADQALARGDVGAALRRLHAFRESHPGLAGDPAAAIAAKETAARTEAKRLATAALTKADATPDPDARRAVLLDAIRGLAATDEGDRLRSALTRVAGGTLPSAGPGAGATPGLPTPSSTPVAPPASAALLAKAGEAQALTRQRAWAKAGEAYRALSASDASPRLKQEWGDRAEEIERVAGLVKELADAVAAAGERPVRVPLAGGIFDVLACDATGVRLHRGEKTLEQPWTSMEAPDLLALLGFAKASPDRHLALAVLAADLGDRKAALEHLLPLVSDEARRAAAFRVMALRLDGRPSVPPGGYQPLDGDLVDAGEFTRRTEAKHVASLQAEAGSLVEKVAADPAFKRVAALAARRDELDKRRVYALLAIFDEIHWPYPHPASIMRYYEVVWQEIVARTKAVREVWDEKEVVKVPKGGELQKHVERHAAVCAELETKGVDTAELKAAMEHYAPYVGETLSIRTYFRDADEKALLAYNRWVMDVYNPSRTAVIAEPEREENRITNEYRVMMGYGLRVAPGPDPIEAIDGKTVVKILDKNREAGRFALHAVRIDDRLVASARGHSVDMVQRGYFAHEAPANPGTGEPTTMPWDRMQKQGYGGGAASENIAKAGSAQGAHDEWLFSSGHHRNILSPWDDQGVGLASPCWTQNFGAGGGLPTEVPAGGGVGEVPPPPPSVPPPEGSGRGGKTGKEGKDPKDPKEGMGGK